MKFRQRQILLTIGLISVGIFLLNSRLLSGKLGNDLRVVDPPFHLKVNDLRGNGPELEINLRTYLQQDYPQTVQNNSSEQRHDHEIKSSKNSIDESLKHKNNNNNNKNNKNQTPVLTHTSVDLQTVRPPNDARKVSHRVIYVKRPSNADCPTLLRPKNVQDTQEFQEVGGTSLTYVFSAYLDKDERAVRMIALNSARERQHYCLLWYENATRDLVVMPASLHVLPENHNKRYSAAYIHCFLPDSHLDPYAVSVTHNDCRSQDVDVQEPTSVLLVHSPKRITRNFTLCVTPLNFKYSRAYELVEMIELNRLLGADRFTFYVNSVGPNVEKILRWYSDRGIVDLVKWELPIIVDHWPPSTAKPEVHYFAQVASHNDCLNRQRGASRYAVYEDLDEFIIPKKHTRWLDLLEHLDRQGHDSSVYVFRCVFFRKDWPRNEEDYPGRQLAEKFRSVVLSTDKREITIFRHGQRAKYIVNPKAVDTVGIHNIWAFRGPSRSKSVDEKDALLHHYRDWENPDDPHPRVRDTDIYRFRQELLQRLAERWKELPDVPLDIPISDYGQV